MTDDAMQGAIAVHDHGFVRLDGTYGDDATVARAARVSYAPDSTKKVRGDEALIRYLMRNQHHTPFEMVDFRFHVKCPIFVARQWFRHRTASINEISGRYSVLPDETYVPARDRVRAQSSDNKQGSGDALAEQDVDCSLMTIHNAYENAAASYAFLGGRSRSFNPDLTKIKLAHEANVLNAAMEGGKDEAWINQKLALCSVVDPTDDFTGIARETARVVLPLGQYTEFFWKVNLRNLFHFLHLRSDPHAQSEIRDYAAALASFVRPAVPLCWDAFEDYVIGGSNMGREEMEALRVVLAEVGEDRVRAAMSGAFVRGTAREQREFLSKLGFPLPGSVSGGT